MRINPFQKVKRSKTKNKRTIYKYEEMIKDTWTDFIEEIDKQIQKLHCNSHHNSLITNLNKLWYNFSQAIILVAKTHILQTKVAPKIYFALSTKASKLHKALKLINKLLYKLKNYPTKIDISYINNSIILINKLAET